MSGENQFLLYTAPDGAVKVEVFFKDETVWLTQSLMAELFQKDVRTINEHLVNIFDGGELSREATIRKFRIVRSEGSREVTREIEHYSLPAILAVGYRVRSPRGVQFRRWASTILKEYLTKGFAMNPEAEVFAVKSLADVDDIKALLDDPDALEAKVGRRFSEASLADIRTAIATLEALIGESDADDAPDEDGKALDDGSHEAPVADAPDAPEGPRMDEAKRRELLNTLTRDLATLTID